MTGLNNAGAYHFNALFYRIHADSPYCSYSFPALKSNIKQRYFFKGYAL